MPIEELAADGPTGGQSLHIQKTITALSDALTDFIWHAELKTRSQLAQKEAIVFHSYWDADSPLPRRLPIIEEEEAPSETSDSAPSEFALCDDH